MERIGIVLRRQREAGSWVIDEEPLGEGEGWQDWPAFHRVATTDRGRIRFLVTPPGATATERARIRQVAEHEYRIMSRLANDRLLRPRDMVDSELGVGLVYPLDERFQRLDLWLADHAGSVSAETQLLLLRQVAEAVAYAHGNRVVHRGLTPHAVWVHQPADGDLRVLVGDWRSAGTVAGPGPTGLSGSGVTGLMGASDGGGQASAAMRPGAVDVDRRLAEAFQAPEGVWNQDADRIRLDVFALGALAYYVLAGRPAAADRAALRERLHRDNGLDLAADLPQVPSAVRALVLEATRPAVSERLPDVRSFLERLAEAERALAGPAEDVIDPLGAAPGAVIDGRFRLERRLGAGSTAVGLLVTDLSVDGSGRTPSGCSRWPGTTRRPAGSPGRPRCSPGWPTRGWCGWSRARSRSAAGRPWCWRAPARRRWARCCAAASGCPWTCWSAGAPTCWRRWSRWTGPASTTGTSSPPTSASGRAAATGPSTWSCSTSRCRGPGRPP